jgi:hypothetical protein
MTDDILSEERIAEIEHDLFDDMNGDGGYCLHVYRAPISAIFACYHALATKLKEATDEIKLRTDENDLMRSTFRDAVSRAELADTYEQWLLDIGKLSGCGHVDERLPQCIEEHVAELETKLATATEWEARWEQLHDDRVAELDAKDRDIDLLKQEYSRATSADVAALAAKDAELKEATEREQRLREVVSAADYAFGTTSWPDVDTRDTIRRNVLSRIKAALADAPAAQPSEAERPAPLPKSERDKVRSFYQKTMETVTGGDSPGSHNRPWGKADVFAWACRLCNTCDQLESEAERLRKVLGEIRGVLDREVPADFPERLAQWFARQLDSISAILATVEGL